MKKFKFSGFHLLAGYPFLLFSFGLIIMNVIVDEWLWIIFFLMIFLCNCLVLVFFLGVVFIITYIFIHKKEENSDRYLTFTLGSLAMLLPGILFFFVFFLALEPVEDMNIILSGLLLLCGIGISSKHWIFKRVALASFILFITYFKVFGFNAVSLLVIPTILLGAYFVTLDYVWHQTKDNRKIERGNV